MMVVLALAKPIEKGRRSAFLTAVAGALTASPARGPGVAHRIAREILADFFIPPRMSDAGEMGARSRSPKMGFGLNRAGRWGRGLDSDRTSQRFAEIVDDAD
jgi:hypothetical protein